MERHQPPLLPLASMRSQHAVHLSCQCRHRSNCITPVACDTGNVAIHFCSWQAIGLQACSQGSAPGRGPLLDCWYTNTISREIAGESEK